MESKHHTEVSQKQTHASVFKVCTGPQLPAAGRESDDGDELILRQTDIFCCMLHRNALK